MFWKNFAPRFYQKLIPRKKNNLLKRPSRITSGRPQPFSMLNEEPLFIDFNDKKFIKKHNKSIIYFPNYLIDDMIKSKNNQVNAKFFYSLLLASKEKNTDFYFKVSGYCDNWKKSKKTVDRYIKTLSDLNWLICHKKTPYQGWYLIILKYGLETYTDFY